MSWSRPKASTAADERPTAAHFSHTKNRKKVSRLRLVIVAFASKKIYFCHAHFLRRETKGRDKIEKSLLPKVFFSFSPPFISSYAVWAPPSILCCPDAYLSPLPSSIISFPFCEHLVGGGGGIRGPGYRMKDLDERFPVISQDSLLLPPSPLETCFE